jgi:hypothetical protein
MEHIGSISRLFQRKKKVEVKGRAIAVTHLSAVGEIELFPNLI